MHLPPLKVGTIFYDVLYSWTSLVWASTVNIPIITLFFFVSSLFVALWIGERKFPSNVTNKITHIYSFNCLVHDKKEYKWSCHLLFSFKIIEKWHRVTIFHLIRKLHLLACTHEPELHRYIAALKSKLVDIYIDGSNKKQTSITEYVQKNSL